MDTLREQFGLSRLEQLAEERADWRKQLKQRIETSSKLKSLIAKEGTKGAAFSWRAKYLESCVELAEVLQHLTNDVREVRALYQDGSTVFHSVIRLLDYETPVIVSEQVATISVKRRLSEVPTAKIIDDQANPPGFKTVQYSRKPQPLLPIFWMTFQSAMISQDWDLVDAINRDYAVHVESAPNRVAQSGMIRALELIRAALVGDLRLGKQLGSTFKFSKPSPKPGEFSPQRLEFACGIAEREPSLLEIALKTTNTQFKNKWNLARHLTPQNLKQFGSEKNIFDEVWNNLARTKWLISPWAISMMCLAAHLGMTEMHKNPALWSEWIPLKLCQPKA